MKSLYFLNKQVTARFVAAVTVLSLLVSALPAAFFVAEAAPVDLYGPTNATVTEAAPFNSGTIDASGHQDLELTFKYDASELAGSIAGQGIIPDESFTYGWKSGTTTHDLGTIEGFFLGIDPFNLSKGTITVNLPPEAQVADLEIYITVESTDSSSWIFVDKDRVKVKNLTVTGEPIPAPCPDGYTGVSPNCVPPTVSACDAPTEVVTTNLSTWDLSKTRATGHNEITADGLHVWTDGSTNTGDNGSGGTWGTDKAAGYYATDFSLSDLGNQTIDEALDYVAAFGIEPGLQLVTDFDNNGTIDGILVGEPVYGNTWWVSESAAFVQTGAPNTGTGYGSSWYGTANEWLAEFPNAQVKAIGYSLGSGVHGDGVIKSINLGCVKYTFAPPPVCSLTITSDDTDFVEEKNALAELLTFVHGGWLQSIPSSVAGWIWGDDPVTDTTVAETQTFVKKFDWTGGTPTSAILKVASDNGHSVTLGTFVGGNNAANTFAATTDYDVSGAIVSGENTLEIAVTNTATPNDTNPQANPAGLIYELTIVGEGESCGSVTPITPVVVATLNITSPVADYDVVSGVHDFTAEYVDNDSVVDNIQWAIRAGTCAASTGTVAGNVDSHNDYSSFVGSAFSATVDTSGFAPGEYCFVVNPNEQNGEPDLRATRKFVIEEPPTSEVTICKYDNADEPKALSGWQLTLLGNKVGEVSAPGNGTVVSLEDVPAGEYVAKASGTYKYRTDAVSIADARFSQRRTGEPMTAPYEPWRIGNLGGLHINGFTGGVTNADWGTVFSPSHVYYAPLSLATTDDVEFKVGDDQYNDNSGALLAELYTGYTGMTGEDGCVTFEDVPYGTYQIEELLQSGWENVSGLGTVEIVAETETFNVTNRDLSIPLTCEVSIQSSTSTVIDSYGLAVETYDGNNLWTGVIPNAKWIWSDFYVTDPEASETHTFTETFNVTNPSAATLVINADNWYKIIVNGTEVVHREENSYQAFQQKTYTDVIKNALVSGDNTIEFMVTNDAMEDGTKLTNPAGLLFSLTVTGEGEDEDCVVTTEPEEDPNIPPVEVCGEGYTGTYPNCVEIDNSTTTPDSGDGDVPAKKKNSGGTKVKTLAGPTPFVLGASTSQCGMYLFDYLKEGQNNNETEVMKLQAFLIGQGYLGIQMNGIFDDATDQAVKDFQLKYAAEILDPWVSAGILTVSPPTGWVYQLTRWKINNIVCPGSEATPTLLP